MDTISKGRPLEENCHTIAEMQKMRVDIVVRLFTDEYKWMFQLHNLIRLQRKWNEEQDSVWRERKWEENERLEAMGDASMAVEQMEECQAKMMNVFEKL